MAYEKLQEYINNYWPTITVDANVEIDGHITLPNKFIAPSSEIVNNFVFREQFYWDTYFILQGFEDANDFELKKGMVDNLLFMFEQQSYIPNSNNLNHNGRSQPPFLSMMIAQIFDYSKDIEWLERAYHIAVKEHTKVWMGKKFPHERLVPGGLSRYYNSNLTHQGAEDESGWDYTTRFDNRALDFVPIDLNSLLYAYEMDLSSFATLLGREKEAHEWFGAATVRKMRINKQLYSEADGFFFDYDFVAGRFSSVRSLAPYYAMFVGLTTPKQNQELVENLNNFITDHGLTTTDKEYPPADGKQWASPNGWAPLHYIVVEGLKRTGYGDLAKEIAINWVNTVNAKFEQTGMIFEKYNVVDISHEPVSAVYPDQRGFAWTNAVTLRFIRDFSLN
jgi:alpha,alpha-trehalase